MTKRKTVRPKRAGHKIARPKQAESNGQFLDGTIVIDIRSGPYDGKTLRMDATVVNIAANRLIVKFGLKPGDDGFYELPAEFGIELCDRLKELGYDSTPTIALHAWSKAVDYWNMVQKKTS